MLHPSHFHCWGGDWERKYPSPSCFHIWYTGDSKIAKNPFPSHHGSWMTTRKQYRELTALKSASTEQAARGRGRKEHKKPEESSKDLSLHKGIFFGLISWSHLSSTKATLQALLQPVSFNFLCNSFDYKEGLKLQGWGGSVKESTRLQQLSPFRAQSSLSFRSSCSSKSLASVKYHGRPKGTVAPSTILLVQDSVWT